MHLTPDSLRLFASRAHNLLRDGVVEPRRVLVHRLNTYKPRKRCSHSLAHEPRLSSSSYSLPAAGQEPTGAILPDRGLALPGPSEIAKLPFSRRALPVSCPGCGTLSQEVSPKEPGFYTRTRHSVKSFLHRQGQKDHVPIVQPLRNLEREGRGTEGKDTFHEHKVFEFAKLAERPVCDRCHELKNYARGRSIAHPSLQDLADTIAESPFRVNHVYHVLDAADFPMSLFPNVFEALNLAKPRSQNRRAKQRYSTKPSVSFLITRADLLGSNKETVDKMMPYFQEVLRTALGRIGRGMRLGNVHLLSAKRGWWTKDVKKAIWERGGGNWMVGRVNVGKSNLFEVLFPKGYGERAPVYGELENSQILEQDHLQQHTHLSEDSLLPPPQPEAVFPSLPLVSNLPGTTASPIRLPFGNHRGELIDLPGLERGNLEESVAAGHKTDLVMQYRPNVAQHIIKPGQSLLLGGGLIRITPNLDPEDPSTTLLAYPFVPLEAHVTNTDKAIETQQQQRESGITTILAEGAGKAISSAGVFSLTSDVTKSRAATLVRAGVAVSRLPFRVYSTDILIEGVGWIELACQVRRRRSEGMPQEPSTAQEPLTRLRTEIHPTAGTSAGTNPTEREINGPTASAQGQQQILQSDGFGAAGLTPSGTDVDARFQPFATQFGTAGDVATPPPSQPLATQPNHVGPIFPQVEIFSPAGKHVAQRKPLGAWLAWDEARKQKMKKTTRAVRPKKSMKGVKKQTKILRRAGQGPSGTSESSSI